MRSGDLGDGPEEAGELSGDSDDGLGGSLAAMCQPHVFAVKPGFGFASDGEDGEGLAVSPSGQIAAGSGTVAVVPGGFDEDPTEVRVAGFGDGTLTALPAAAVFGRNQAGGGHELRGFGVASQISDFRHESEGSTCGHAAKDLEAGGFGRELRLLSGFLEEPIEALDLLEAFHDGRLILLEDGLSVRLLEAEGSDPVPVTLGPGLAVPIAVTVSKQELAEPVATTEQIDLRVFSSADEVSQRFLPFVRDRHQRQFFRAIQASQLVGISPVRLDPIARPSRDQGRCGHGAIDPRSGQSPLRFEAAGPSFVDAANIPAQPLQPSDQSPKTPRVRNTFQPLARFAARGSKRRTKHRVRMPIQPHPDRRILHDRFLPSHGSTA
jgi:hypothetical protein